MKCSKFYTILALMMFLAFSVGCKEDEESNLPDKEGVYGSAETSTTDESIEEVFPEITAQGTSETYESALSNLDLTQCEEISDPVIKESCVVNIAFAQAKESQDIAACDPIINEETKASCVKMVEESKKTDDYNPLTAETEATQ